MLVSFPAQRRALLAATVLTTLVWIFPHAALAQIEPGSANDPAVQIPTSQFPYQQDSTVQVPVPRTKAGITTERVTRGKPTKSWIKDSEGHVLEGDDGNTGNMLVREASRKARPDLDDAGLSEVIALCEEGIKSNASANHASYAKKLMAWAHNRRGEKFADIGSEEHALREFIASVEADPSAWRPLHNRGVSYARLGKTKEALADFDRVLVIHNTYANSWFNRAELRFQSGDVASSLQDYDQAIRLQPREAAFYCGRGLALAKLGRNHESMQDFDEAVRIDPSDARSLVARGEAFREQGNWQRAASDFRDAIRMNPRYGKGYQAAAWLMSTCPDERFRNPQLGLSTAKKALELDGDDDYHYGDTLAAALANLGQFEAAKEIAKSTLRKVPVSDLTGFKARLALYESSKAYRENQTAEVSRPQAEEAAEVVPPYSNFRQ